MVQEAYYTSVWSDGVELHSECMVDMDTKEVFDIEQFDVDNLDGNFDSCVDEYITLLDGSMHDVHSFAYINSMNDNYDGFWYY